MAVVCVFGVAYERASACAYGWSVQCYVRLLNGEHAGTVSDRSCSTGALIDCTTVPRTLCNESQAFDGHEYTHHSNRE